MIPDAVAANSGCILRRTTVDVGTHPPAGSTVVDLAAIVAGASGNGVHWTPPEPSDLNVNVVRLDPSQSIAEHVNREIDVLFVVLHGAGWLVIDGHAHGLSQHSLINVPAGAARERSIQRCVGRACAVGERVLGEMGLETAEHHPRRVVLPHQHAHRVAHTAEREVDRPGRDADLPTCREEDKLFLHEVRLEVGPELQDRRAEHGEIGMALAMNVEDRCGQLVDARECLMQCVRRRSSNRSRHTRRRWLGPGPR